MYFPLYPLVMYLYSYFSSFLPYTSPAPSVKKKEKKFIALPCTNRRLLFPPDLISMHRRLQSTNRSASGNSTQSPTPDFFFLGLISHLYWVNRRL